MAEIDMKYNEVARGILDFGYTYMDASRDKECKQLSSVLFDFPMTGRFPLLTTKKMYHKGIIGELLWFLRGSDDIRDLWADNISIWDKDWYNSYSARHENPYTIKEVKALVAEGAYDGLLEREDFSVGQNYGVQWRNFTDANNENGDGIDQVTNMLAILRSDAPIRRRNIVTAWNPAETTLTALPPCHWSWEILPRPLTRTDKIRLYAGRDIEHWDALAKAARGNDDNAKEAEAMLEGYFEERSLPTYGFSLKWHQRSVDTFLGLPFNIASYGVLGKIIEALTGMCCLNIMGDLSNVHFYGPHIESVKEQLKNSPTVHEGCDIEFSKKFIDLAEKFRNREIDFSQFIGQLRIEDISFPEYTSFESIKAEMFAPTK